jgi:hypothetical protein
MLKKKEEEMKQQFEAMLEVTKQDYEQLVEKEKDEIKNELDLSEERVF